MVKKMTRREATIPLNITVSAEEPMMSEEGVAPPMAGVIPPAQAEPAAPMEPGYDDKLMAAVNDIQESVVNLSSRMDKVENKPMEDGAQEVPTLEAAPGEPLPGTKQVGGAAKEEVNTGGENKPADFSAMGEKDKDKGATEDPKNVMQEMVKTMMQMAKKMEDLTGAPEVPKGKEEVKGPASPDNISSIPATQQPPEGTATSGGGFDSDDKIAADEEADVGNKPKKDYSKPPVVKNELDDSLTAGKEDDPTKPQPGETKDNPDPMDMKTPKERYVNEILKKLREEIDEEKEEEEKEDEPLKELFMTKKEATSLTRRQSVVSGSKASERLQNAPANRVGISERMRESNPTLAAARENAQLTVKEYLQKPGVCNFASSRNFGF